MNLTHPLQKAYLEISKECLCGHNESCIHCSQGTALRELIKQVADKVGVTLYVTNYRKGPGYFKLGEHLL